MNKLDPIIIIVYLILRMLFIIIYKRKSLFLELFKLIQDRIYLLQMLILILVISSLLIIHLAIILDMQKIIAQMKLLISLQIVQDKKQNNVIHFKGSKFLRLQLVVEQIQSLINLIQKYQNFIYMCIEKSLLIQQIYLIFRTFLIFEMSTLINPKFYLLIPLYSRIWQNQFIYIQNILQLLIVILELLTLIIIAKIQKYPNLNSFLAEQYLYLVNTGSGLSAILSDRIKEEYQSIITQCNLLVPSIQQNDLCVVSPYNSTLAFNMLMDSAEQLIFYDNQGLKQNFTRLGNTFEYDNANLLVAQTISCNSSPFRHPGDINSSLRKLSTNLIPFPELKLLTSGLTNNLYSDYYKEYLQMNEYQVFKELMSTDHNQASTDYTHGRFLTAALSLRGNISNKEIDKETSLFQNFIENYNSYYKSNIARKVFQVNMFFTNICKKSYQNFDYFGSCLVNSTSISESLKSLDEKFSKMQIRKSYMYKYTQEGIEEDEFIEAQTRLRDTCHYYEDRNTQEMGENQEYYE